MLSEALRLRQGSYALLASRDDRTVSFPLLQDQPEIIRLAVMLYVRFPLSSRNVEDLLRERCILISHESVRYSWNRFGLKPRKSAANAFRNSGLI